MPFNGESARQAVKTRWDNKPPNSRRTQQLKINISPDEEALLDVKVKEAGLSKTEAVIQAIIQYQPNKYAEGVSMFPKLSYEEYLVKTSKPDSRDSWVDWKVECHGMDYDEARKALIDPEWGYEKITSADNSNDVVCDICIRAIKSRGEPIMVGEAVHNNRDENPLRCFWCKDSELDTLYKFTIQ
jgi:hypothetical protein